MGLILSVYRDASGVDCTAGGISSNHTDLTAINVEGPFEPTQDRPPVILENHYKNAVRIVPAGPDGKALKLATHAGPMFGGNFATTSDSRLGEAIEKLVGIRFYGAVPIHDRYETWEINERLSR